MTSTAKVSGAGKPPENVNTSPVAPAVARIALISASPDPAARRENRRSQSIAADGFASPTSCSRHRRRPPPAPAPPRPSPDRPPAGALGLGVVVAPRPRGPLPRRELARHHLDR